MERRFTGLLLIVVVFVFAACGGPRTFVRQEEPGWVSIEIREGVQFEEAWNSVVDVLAKKFELEMISKDGGYIRTTWLHGWDGVPPYPGYTARIIIKFSPDRKLVDIKVEANLLEGSCLLPAVGPTKGIDSSLLNTVKTDIMGVLSRTAR